MPIVAWGNGGCRNSSGEFRNFLTGIASHGFLIVAIGPAMASVGGGSDLPGGGSKSAQLLDGVNWAIAENGRAGGEYFGKLNAGKIAVMGQSCGGLQVIEVAEDPRITTTVLWDSGVLNAPPLSAAGPTLPIAKPPTTSRASTTYRFCSRTARWATTRPPTVSPAAARSRWPGPPG
jgi:dienelactone hydrolase